MRERSIDSIATEPRLEEEANRLSAAQPARRDHNGPLSRATAVVRVDPAREPSLAPGRKLFRSPPRRLRSPSSAPQRRAFSASADSAELVWFAPASDAQRR